MTPSRSSPNLLIIGAPKCATTSLHYYLGQHPQVFMSEPKEPHFFDEDAHYARGLDHYLRTYFAGAGAFKVRGESTPAYLRRHAKVIPRIEHDLDHPALKFIVLLRDPVQRAWSHFLHSLRNGEETEPFERALELEDERNARGAGGWHGYFSDGLYAQQISAWLERFPREAFLILLTDDLKKNGPGVLREVCEFIGVDPGFPFETAERHNRAASPRSVALNRLLNTPNRTKGLLKLLAPETVRKRLGRTVNRLNLAGSSPRLDPGLSLALRARYRPEVTALEEILGRDLSAWK